jgi:hypothetical protein
MARETVDCERCGARLFVNNINQHMRMCVKIPPDDGLREAAKTYTITQMATMWGVSTAPINSRLKRLGVKAMGRYGNPLSKEQLATLIEMYNDNYVLYEIEHKLGISTDRLRMEVKNLVRAQVLSLRKTVTRPKTQYKLCSICDARLDYGYDTPSADGVCGLCLADVDLPHDTFVMGNRFLAARVIRQAIRDSQSNNGHSYSATWWLDSEGATMLFDLVGVISRGGAMRLLSKVGRI